MTPRTDERPDAVALRAVAIEVAGQAAEVLTRYQATLRGGGTLAVATKSSDTDPVSIADTEAERTLVASLTRLRPHDGLLGEEGADRAGTSGLRWVIDPLDGTVNFLYGHVGWAVSVCVEARADLYAPADSSDGWVGVAAAVVEPSTGRVYAAARGHGATRDGMPLRVNDPVTLAHALVATGFTYDRAHRVRQAEMVASIIDQVRDVRRVGSAALDCCRVAEGTVDAYYEDSLHRWDWAGGALVAAEAGATVSRLDGAKPGQSGVVVAGPALHDALRALIRGGG